MKQRGLTGLGSVAPPELAELAESLRRVTDRMLRVEGQPEALRRAREHLEAAAAQLEPHARPGEALRLGREDEPPDARPYYVDGVIFPRHHPLAAELEIATDDGRSAGRVSFGVAFEGPPGCVHGALVASFFDQILGHHNLELGLPAMTASLTVHYRNPTPLFRELAFEACIDRVEGRKIHSAGSLRVGDRVTAEAEGLFVLPARARIEALGELVRAR